MATASNDALTVRTIRVVAHTMGPVVPGGQLSQNHWSVYLLTNDGNSVRLNMIPQPTNLIGSLNITTHMYTTSESAVRFFDFPSVEVPVEYILQLIHQKGRERFRFEERGVGCRHWVYVKEIYETCRSHTYHTIILVTRLFATW